MIKRLSVMGVILTVVALALSLVSPALSRNDFQQRTIRLTDRFSDDDENFTYVDVPPKDFSVGDYFAAHDVVYNPANTERRGITFGDCLVVAKDETLECDITFHLGRETITTEGTFFPRDRNVWAVTGGTGAYKTAHGELTFQARKDHLDLTFKLHL